MVGPAILRQAFGWQCPYCAKMNVTLAVIAELTYAEKHELLALSEFEEVQTGDFFVKPDIVECEACHKIFDTELG